MLLTVLDNPSSSSKNKGLGGRGIMLLVGRRIEKRKLIFLPFCWPNWIGKIRRSHFQPSLVPCFSSVFYWNFQTVYFLIMCSFTSLWVGLTRLLPVARSFISAITLLGTPSETYQFGFIYYLIGIAYILVMPAAGYLYLPVFWNLNVSTQRKKCSFWPKNLSYWWN